MTTQVEEKWVLIPETNNKYQISNFGRIRNAKTGRLRKTYISAMYPYFTCYVDGKMKGFTVHSLVAKAFLPKIEGKNQVNHKDLNKLNNVVDNLEWCTHSENQKHKYSNGLGLEKQSQARKNWHSNNDHPNAKMVLNTQTGIYYKSVSDAAKSIGIRQSSLNERMLLGRGKQFIYV